MLPFTSTPDSPSKGWRGGENGIAAPTKRCHARAAVHRLWYSVGGLTLTSVGTNESVCFYHGTTMELRRKVVNTHSSLSVYSCSWDCSVSRLLTFGADRCTRLHNRQTGRGLGGWDLAR
jgi:hypothetical protein